MSIDNGDLMELVCQEAIRQNPDMVGYSKEPKLEILIPNNHGKSFEEIIKAPVPPINFEI